MLDAISPPFLSPSSACCDITRIPFRPRSCPDNTFQANVIALIAMRREIPAVRILPMSDKTPGFVGRDIADVQRRTFLRDLSMNGGRFRYPRAGLNAPAGGGVLF